jgi:hypothetical protein
MRYCLPARGIYYLIYRDEGDSKRTYIGVRYPSWRATPLVVLCGKRARDVYRFITQVLENRGLKCREVENNGEKIIELPWATGFAASFFLLSVYSTRKPLKYAFAFERMITGEMPLSKYMVSLVNLAVSLSRYIENKSGYTDYPKQIVNAKAAKTVSRMAIHLLESIAPCNHDLPWVQIQKRT